MTEPSSTNNTDPRSSPTSVTSWKSIWPEAVGKLLDWILPTTRLERQMRRQLEKDVHDATVQAFKDRWGVKHAPPVASQPAAEHKDMTMARQQKELHDVSLNYFGETEKAIK